MNWKNFPVAISLSEIVVPYNAASRGRKTRAKRRRSLPLTLLVSCIFRRSPLVALQRRLFFSESVDVSFNGTTVSQTRSNQYTLIRFSLKFILKETKLNKAGEAPLHIRITVNRKSAEISIKRHVQPSKWNGDTQKEKGILTRGWFSPCLDAQR